MSGTRERLETFIAAWRGRLCGDSAAVRFEVRPLDAPPGLHTVCADELVTSLGYQPIGRNWELLDPAADRDAPRSARAALVEAFGHNMVFARNPWLGDAGALAMAEDFLGCFDPESAQIVTNRMYFGWNPITSATFEWAFVACDRSAIALLLATDED